MDTWGLIGMFEVLILRPRVMSRVLKVTRFSAPDEKTAEIRNRQDETLNHHEDIIENLDRLNNTIAFILKVSTLGLRISFGCDTASLAQA